MKEPGMETERICPECGDKFLIRTVSGELRCPNGDYVTTAPERERE